MIQKIQKKDRIVITGGKGFLGSHVYDKFIEKGYLDVVSLSSKDYNLISYEETLRMYTDLKPDVLIHLAARVGGIGETNKYPASFFYENMQMGLNIFECAIRRGRLKKLVSIGSVCAYPKHAPIPFREEDIWNGYPEETNASYGLAKKMLITLTQAYKKQYDLCAIHLIPVNLYGPRDKFDLESSHVIPAMIMKFYEAKISKAENVVLWGDGSPTREFLYVEDCAEGIVLATEKYFLPEPVNLGSGFEITIRDLANIIKKEIGYEGGIKWDTSKPNGQPRRLFDSSKAFRYFGFKAKTSFETGLALTIKWFLDNMQKAK